MIPKHGEHFLETLALQLLVAVHVLAGGRCPENSVRCDRVRLCWRANNLAGLGQGDVDWTGQQSVPARALLISSSLKQTWIHLTRPL